MKGLNMLFAILGLIVCFQRKSTAFILPDKTESFYGPPDLEKPTYNLFRDGYISSKNKAKRDLFYINRKPDLVLNDLTLVHLGNDLDMDDEESVPYISNYGHQFAVDNTANKVLKDDHKIADIAKQSTVKPVSINVKKTKLPLQKSSSISKVVSTDVPTETKSVGTTVSAITTDQTTKGPLNKAHLPMFLPPKPSSALSNNDKSKNEMSKEEKHKNKKIIRPTHGMAVAAPRMMISQPKIAMQPRMIMPQPQISVQPRMVMPQPQIAVQPRMVMPQPQIAVQPRMVMPQPQVAMQPRMVMPQPQVAMQPRMVMPQPQVAMQPRMVMPQPQVAIQPQIAIQPRASSGYMG